MINPHLDLFAVFIFLGVMQGFYLTVFFLFRKGENHLSNLLFGSFLLVLSVVILDIFTGYTNYIIYFMYLNNITEPLNFLFGPLIYLYTYSVISGKQNLTTQQKGHFLPAIFFAVAMVPYFIQPEALKYNEFLGAFHPSVQQFPFNPLIDPDPFYVRRFVNELTILHIFIYSFLSLRLLNNTFKQLHEPFFSMANKTINWLRLLILGLALSSFLILFIKIIFNADLGDYIIASFASIMIYSISFTIMRDSGFFSGRLVINPKKYEKSSLTPEMQSSILKKLETVMNEEKPFLDSTISLTSLAKKLAVSPHALSQVLNESLKKSFFEFIASYRIDAAKEMIRDPKMANIVIEEIAERVGYNSKSAFNNAFKKLTGITPSEYRKL
jgi:AraC-like DNA-binding protein